MARTMHMPDPRHRILPAVVALAAAATGCGDSDADNTQPPLPLGANNARSVAAEALITTGQGSFTVLLPGDLTFTPAVTAALRSLDPGAVQRLTALAAGRQDADGTMTSACAGGGSQTLTTAGSTLTFAFRGCVQSPSTTLDGTVKFTVQAPSPGSNQIAMAAAFDVTVMMGPLRFSESGGYDLVLRTAANPTDNTSYELTGDRFSVALDVGGQRRDQVTMSRFEIGISQQLTATGQQVEHFQYDVDSSWLRGHITVMTTQDLRQIFDLIDPHQYPFDGQILIRGAGDTQLQITILGDETFTPPAGQGQIELQVDPGTGEFGGPIWTSWSELTAMVMAGS